MKYFKIKIGYDKSEFISIDETELEKAIGVFLTDGKGIFQNGVARGQDIIAIQEDWNKALGINPDWKLTPDDHNEMARRGIAKAYKGVITGVTQRVEYLMKNNQSHLIGRNVEIPELDRLQSGEVIEDSKKLGDGSTNA